MPIGTRGENLIFLISQPRAGSTLLQRILGSHPEIHTVSEPWIMLHPIYATRADGIETEYRHSTARVGVESFIDALPDRRDDYDEGVRRMYAHLYSRALDASDKSRFLDKTPRYYLIIPELARVFPEAKFVLLFRNPLAVLASIVTTWARQNASVIQKTRLDLIRAPGLLLEGVQLLGDACSVVRFEELVSDPATVVSALCDRLGLEFHPPMIEYAGSSGENMSWVLGDQGMVYAHSRPRSDRAEGWKQTLMQGPLWRNWGRGYLRDLGRETIEAMGYDYDEPREVLGGRARGFGVVWVNWETSLKPYEEYGLRQKIGVRCAAAIRRAGVLRAETRASLHARGLFGTIRRVFQLLRLRLARTERD